MKTNKILFTTFVSLSLILAGCGKDNNPSAHVHRWGKASYFWENDNANCVAERVCLDDSTHKEREMVNSNYEVITPVTCENDGVGRYTANFTNSAFVTQIVNVTIAALGHEWGTVTYTWSDDNSTCTATRVCAHDDSHVETETANSSYEVVTPATYEADGEAKYTATFENEEFAEQTKNVAIDKLAYHGEVPLLSEDGNTITYGLYPQTNVNDSDLVSALNALTTPESNGWYLYNDEYYAKVSATPYNSSYKFDNGTAIVSGTTYWFKCEPIIWNVLSNNSGEYYILSSVLLDPHRYNESYTDQKDGHYANNYEYSEIRGWLNNDFYNSAFALGNSHIQTTTVDNSAATTDSASNPYVCNNTQDKVFLPSYQDYLNPNYGFTTSVNNTATRYCKPTDWARARGSYYNTSFSFQYNGYYWTRSPYSGDSRGAERVDRSGYLASDYVYDASHSVRPALRITLSD